MNETVSKNGNLDVSKIKVENLTSYPIFLKWETVSNTFPKEWDCSMCQHGKCQIGIPNGSEFKKLDSYKEGFVAIHVLPAKHSGKGQVKFKIYDVKHPDEFEIITFNVEVL